MHRNYSPLDIDFNIDDVSVRALLLKFTDDALKAKAQGHITHMRRRIPIIINIEHSYHYTRPYSSALTIISPLKGELPFCETNIFLEYNIVPNCFKLAKLILERKNLISCQCISNINIYIMQLSPIGL